MSQNIVYNSQFETLLKDEAEKAESMSILHQIASLKYNKFSVGINIPIIILSSTIGFLSVLTVFPPVVDIVLGSVSIGIGILKAIESYFGFTKLSEHHRLTSLAYNKISKYIQIQLSLPRECRINAHDILNLIQSDLQNIKDSEPVIPDDVVIFFNNKYKDELTKKPPICNGLTSVNINNLMSREPSSNYN